MYIVSGEANNASQLLSWESISVNNLKIKVNDSGECTLETKGEWRGNLMELVSILEEVTTKIIEVKDGQDTQQK